MTTANGRAARDTVRISRHALERLRLRFPLLEKASDEVLGAMARREVSQGIDAGRMAACIPRFAGGTGGRSVGVREGNARYAWDIIRLRVWVLTRLNGDHPAGKGWVIMTVLTGDGS